MGMNNFSSEKENIWVRQFHEEAVCNKIVTRLAWQALCLSCLFWLESCYMVTFQAWTKDHDNFAGYYRIPVFMGCQLVCIGLIMGWWLAAKNEWIQQPLSCATVQAGMLVTYVVCLILMYISYDMLTTNKDDVFELSWLTKYLPQKQDFLQKRDVKVPLDPYFAIVYTVIFFYTISMNRARFYHSPCALPVIVPLIFSANWTGFGKVFFSDKGKMYFCNL